MLEIDLVRLDPGLPVPARAHADDAGLDLHAAVDVELAPGERALVGTGVALALPPGHAGFVHPRSGLAARHGLGVLNAPGTIDAGYRGEIRVCLVNHDPVHAVALRRGDRIAQLVITRIEIPVVRVLDPTPGAADGEDEDPGSRLPPSSRGTGGFGSTGTGPTVAAESADGAGSTAGTGVDTPGTGQGGDR